MTEPTGRTAERAVDLALDEATVDALRVHLPRVARIVSGGRSATSDAQAQARPASSTPTNADRAA